MTIPTLNALWRVTPRDDRELIRGYAGWPLSTTNLTELTSILNRVAITSAAAVTQVQRWIDEIENLEADYAERVENNTAHLGNAGSYEGPVPGTTLTRDAPAGQLTVTRVKQVCVPGWKRPVKAPKVPKE